MIGPMLNFSLRPFLGWCLVLLFAGPLRAQPAPSSPRLFIIDDDTAMLKREVRHAGSMAAPWIPITDPDGGLEVIYALRQPGVQVLGLTCTMGCSTTQVCMDSDRRILELTGHLEIPILRGADSPADLGQPTDAARFIVDTVMAHPGQVEIIATAPLTNIATALMLEPRLPQYWKMLHLASGEFLGALGPRSDAVVGRYVGYKDLNLNVDPKAAQYVLDHADNFIIYPNEIMDDARFTFADRRALKKTGTPLARFIADETAPFLRTMGLFNALSGHPGIYLHGVIPAAIAFDPDLAEDPTELRVIMVRHKLGGFSFAISEDVSVPARPVYVRLRDPRTVETRIILGTPY